MCKIIFVFSLVIALCLGDNKANLTALKFSTPCTTPNQDLGYCLKLNKCHLFVNITITKQHESYDFIKASNCGPNNGKLDLICCGRYNNFIEQIEKHASTTKAPKPAKPHTINPLPKNCGVQKLKIFSRIFGGSEAVIGEFPWAVRLMHRTKHGYRNYGCGGVLIHKLFVLTAAHCINSAALETFGPIFQVVLGEHDSETAIDCTKDTRKICADEPQYIPTGKPVVYKSYNNVSNINDIALIPLKRAAKMSDYVQPICLTDSLSKAQLMWITGWGKTEDDEASSIKLKVEVPFVAHNICFDKYAAVNVEVNKKTQICAGGIEGKDSCAGDSGGPLMAERDGIWYADGLVSFGFGCGKKGWPGIYTYLPPYLDWIKNKITSKLCNQLKRRSPGQSC